MKKLIRLMVFLLLAGGWFSADAQVNCELAVGEYTWLNDLLDVDDCCNNQTVYAYPSGAYTFIYIEKCLGSGPNELYFQDGTFYCSDQIEGGCISAYGLLESDRSLVWSCNRPCKTPEVDRGFIICPGEPVFLEAQQTFPTPPQGPAGPEGSSPIRPCTPRLVAIEISPTIDAVIQGSNGFMVSPTLPTVYRVRSIGVCGGPIAPGVVEPLYTDTIDLFYEILIDCPDGGDAENMGSAAIFEEFTWLSDVVDANDCTHQSITVYQSGGNQFLYIDNGDGTGNLYLDTGQFYCSSTASYDCVAAYNLSEVVTTWNCGAGSDMNDPPSGGGEDHSNDPIFTDFPWLSTVFDPANCTNESVAIYQQGAFQYLLVNDQLYLQDGSLQCQNAPNYDCVAAYNLGAAIYEWDCSTGGSGDSGTADEEGENPTTTPDCSKNTGVIVFEPCGADGDTYVFIQTDDGKLYDLYYASGVVYQARQGQRVNFDFVNAEFDSPCSNATQAIRVTCIEDVPIPTMTCSMNTGTFFFRNCDDGTRFFFIETRDGRILDPYFDAGVSHSPIQGQTVNFDYVEAGNSPCTIAEKAVSITCLQVLDNALPPGDCNNNRGSIFFAQCDDGTDYFFVRNSAGQIFDPYYAAGISFQEYDGAEILFDYVVADFSSPCSQAEQAITITCIEEIVPTEVSNDIPADFESYDVIYRICKGDALEIPNFKREVQCACPPNPQGPCDNFPFNQWAVWSGGPLVDNVSSITVSPTVTTTYEASINAYFCGIGGPSFGPAAETSILVIVDNSTNCDLSNAINQSVFDVSGCPNDIVRIPAPNPGTCPLGPPISTNGAVEVLTIAHDYLEVRLLNNGSFSYAINEEIDLSGVTCPTATYVYQVDITNCEDGQPQTKVFDYRACVGDKIKLTIPTNSDCSTERTLENEEVVEILSIGESFMDIMVLKSGHVSVSALGSESGCANTSHIFSFVTLPNCEEDGLVGSNTNRGKVVAATTGFLAYPSPTQGQVTIQLKESKTAKQLLVHDVFGRTLQRIPLANSVYSQMVQLDISSYKNGIYYIELQTVTGRQVQRIVKNGME